MDTQYDLKTQLESITAERNHLHAELTDLKLQQLRQDVDDHERRIRPLEAGQIKANIIYGLFGGNTLLSFIALVKIFSNS